MPRYLQDAISTSIGNAHPLIGYQLDTTKGLANAWPYFEPNQGLNSFIDPSGIVTPSGVILFQRDGFHSLGASLALHNRFADVTSITWSYGDGSANDVGLSPYARHVYAAVGTYTVTATLVSASLGTKVYTVTLQTLDSSGIITHGEVIGINNAESL